MRGHFVSTRRFLAAAGLLALALALGLPSLDLPACAGETTPRLHVEGRELLFGDTPVRLFGQGDEVLLIKSRADEIAEARWYAPFDANFARLHAFGPFIPDSEEPLQPWPRGQDGRFDLSLKNDAYYDRLRGYLAENRRGGRVVMLQVFDEVGFERGSDRWDLNPFQPDRNVNALGLPAPGRDAIPEFYSLSNARLRTVQERFVRDLVTETRGFGNVIFEICNEYTGPIEWLDHFARLFRSLEPELGCELVVTNMSCSQALLAFEIASPAIDCLDLFHAPDTMRHFTPRQIYDRFLAARAHGKPLLAGRIGPEPDINDRDFAGVRRSRAQFWAIFMAGGVGATTKEDDDGVRTRFGPPMYPEDPEWELSIKALQSFVTEVGDPRALTPDPSMIVAAPSNYAFAMRSPRRLAVYLSEPADLDPLRLRSVPNGEYTVQVYDPVRGAFTAVWREVVTDGTLELAVPTFAEDVALMIDAAPMTVTLLRPPSPDEQFSIVDVVVVRHDGIDGDGDGSADFEAFLRVDGRDLPQSDDRVAMDHVRKRRIERVRLRFPALSTGPHEIEALVVEKSGEARDSMRHRFFER